MYRQRIMTYLQSQLPSTRPTVQAVACPSAIDDHHEGTDDAFLDQLFQESDDAGQLLSDIVAQMPHQTHTLDIDAILEERSRKVLHDLRTPLNAIMGYGGMLSQKGLDDAMRQKCLDAFHEAGQTLLDIMDNGLPLASQKPQQENFICDVETTAEQSLSLLEHEAKDRGIILFNRMGDLHHHAAIEPAALKRVFLNLLGNALRYTESGGAIEMTSRMEANAITILITDTGCGMSEETLSRALVDGVRGEGAKLRAPEGRGMGLAIAHDLLTLAGGHIDLKNAKGGGTTAAVTVPLAVRDTDISSAHPAANINHTQPKGTLPRRKNDTQR